MNRSDVIREVAESTGLPEADARAAVIAFCNSVMGHLENGDSITLCGFGKFELRLRAGHVNVNPLVGAIVDVPDRISAVFLPADGFRRRLNEG